MLRIMSSDRPELRGGLMKRFTTIDASKEVAVVVDPYSTGCLIAKEIQNRGYKGKCTSELPFAPALCSLILQYFFSLQLLLCGQRAFQMR